MQQRQLRLGDILDDYCPRERRLTNHAVVAMVGADVKQTRCTTCDAEHEYKHAKVPRQRRKPESPAGAVCAGRSPARPKRVAHDEPRRGQRTSATTTSTPAASRRGDAEDAALDRRAADVAASAARTSRRRRPVPTRTSDEDDGDARTTKRGRCTGR